MGVRGVAAVGERPPPAGRVLDGAALLMRAVAEGGAAAAGPLREAALSEGAMLHHLLAACTAQVPPPGPCTRRSAQFASHNFPVLYLRYVTVFYGAYVICESVSECPAGPGISSFL